MDKPQEEMQEVGFFGIYKESFKTILSWKKIFTQITLTFVLPMSVIFLAHIVFSFIIKRKIERDEFKTNSSYGYSDHLYHNLPLEWIAYWVFRLIYLCLLLLFSLLSTAAIVYTIATVYSGNEVTFKKVLKIVPKVWMRLALTCLWTFFGFFIYNLVSGVVFFIWETTTDSTFGGIMLYVLMSIYCVGFIYITVIWQLASVVTVLESSYGLKAMLKGNALIKGKRWLSWFVFFGLYIIFVGILIMFYLLVWVSFAGILVGLLCVFLLMILLLVGYVVQTMLYLVCKSYHHEPIDKVGLSSQLGGYLGELEPAFKANKDIQLGHPQSQV